MKSDTKNIGGAGRYAMVIEPVALGFPWLYLSVEWSVEMLPLVEGEPKNGSVFSPRFTVHGS